MCDTFQALTRSKLNVLGLLKDSLKGILVTKILEKEKKNWKLLLNWEVMQVSKTKPSMCFLHECIQEKKLKKFNVYFMYSFSHYFSFFSQKILLFISSQLSFSTSILSFAKWL